MVQEATRRDVTASVFEPAGKAEDLEGGGGAEAVCQAGSGSGQAAEARQGRRGAGNVSHDYF